MPCTGLAGIPFIVAWLNGVRIVGSSAAHKDVMLHLTLPIRNPICIKMCEDVF